MMINRKTDKKETLKLLNHICSYRFEQQFGELEGYDTVDKALGSVVKKLSKML